MSVTSGRKTVLLLGVNETTPKRPDEYFERKAAQMGATVRSGAPASSNTWKLPPGDVWALKPHSGDIVGALTVELAPYIIPQSDWTLGGGLTMAPSYDAHSAELGGGLAPVSVTSGGNLLQKTRASTQPWDASILTPSATAYPPPPAPEVQLKPVDRVAESNLIYPENQPYAILCRPPASPFVRDNFFGFGFGGPIGVSPPTARGGEFYLTLRGNGQAQLWERGGGGWELRKEFPWDQGGRAPDELVMLWVIPYYRNRMAFWAPGSAEDNASLLRLPLPAGFLSPGAGDSRYYEDTLADTGHFHTDYLTGAGPVRADIRRDSLDPFGISRLAYPPSGVVVDTPLPFRSIPAANSPITVQVFGWTPPGTVITAQVYDAVTGTPLIQDASGNFLSVAGRSSYYVAFTLTTADPSQTPLVFGYRVSCPGEWITSSVETKSGGLIMGFEVFGPDVTPDSELGTVALEDPLNELEDPLRTRDQVRSVLALVNPSTGALISNLFEGITFQVPADQRGRAGYVYPSEDWWSYSSVHIISLWSRLAKHKITRSTNYARSIEDPRQPWRLTDILRDLFTQGGVPAEELIIPDYDTRFWAPLDGTPIDLKTVFGSDPTRAILFIAKDIFARLIVRDANANTNGAWRLIDQPDDKLDNVLMSFHRAPDRLIPGKDLIDDASYPAGNTWLATYREWRQAPENTAVVITGVVNSKIYTNAPLQNDAAISDPSSVDYVGDYRLFAPAPNAALTTQEAVDQYARVAFERLCRGRNWWGGVSPLVLITDPTDPYQVRPRPLRINDVVQVYDTAGVARKGIVRSVALQNPYRSDGYQMQQVQGLYLRDDGKKVWNL